MRSRDDSHDGKSPSEPATLAVKVRKTLRHHAIEFARGCRDAWWQVVKVRPSRPILVVGCSRSGTTAVYNTLVLAPGLASLHKETHEFWNFLHPLEENGWESHCLGRDAASDADRNAVSRFFYRHLGGRRFVDKANQNCFRIPYLHALFPDASFVFVKRDGRDNVNSLIRGWGRPDEFAGWSDDLPARVRIDGGRYTGWCFFLFPGWQEYLGASIEEVCAQQWISANEAVLAAKEEIPGDHWAEISYEHMLCAPVKTFKEAFERLDLDFSQEVARHCATLVEHPYNAFSPPRLNKWEAENRERIERIVPKITAMMRRLGYEV